MKTKLNAVTLLACIMVGVISASACSMGKCIQLGRPAAEANAKFEEGYVEFRDNIDGFASEFASSVYSDYGSVDNFAVSPISVYMALSLAAECAAGDTRTEILNAIGTSYDELKEHYASLYGSLDHENKYGNSVVGTLKLGNSIWIQDGTQVNTSCIDALSKYYYAYSYSTDFAADNANANRAIRNFVKEQTRRLIDRDFRLSDETLFTLINTLYLKSVWNTDGSYLPFTDEEYTFKCNDGEKSIKLLQGYYNVGKVIESQNYSIFYTSTASGYKIKFILPKDGYTLDDVFTAETLKSVNSITDYQGVDEENQKVYHTRCLFPEYSASFDGDLREILKSRFGIDLLFKSSEEYDPSCDFSTLTERKVHCDKITHVTKLTVDKKGIEGAAVTVIDMAGDAAPVPYEDVFLDFVVDRAFGFIISDYQNVALFSGVVNNV